jgi:hypothetical protein
MKSVTGPSKARLCWPCNRAGLNFKSICGLYKLLNPHAVYANCYLVNKALEALKYPPQDIALCHQATDQGLNVQVNMGLYNMYLWGYNTHIDVGLSPAAVGLDMMSDIAMKSKELLGIVPPAVQSMPYTRGSNDRQAMGADLKGTSKRALTHPGHLWTPNLHCRTNYIYKVD